MKMFRRDEGFTLVELMVVVLIIGILVAIAIPVFNAAKANAQRKSCYANQRTLEGAYQTWAADNDSPGVTFAYPASLVPQYVKREPLCPANNAAYTMTASGTVNSTISPENLTLTTGEVHAHFN